MYKIRGLAVRSVIIAAIVLAGVLPSVSAHAQTYKGGVYGDGAYGADANAAPAAPSNISSSVNDSTVVKTTSGLEVAINLADGQAIPSTGYYITITPLNGRGKTFDKAEIYLDGKRVFVGVPDATGTLKWFWDTNKHPATKVNVVIYGPGQDTIAHEFNVKVTSVRPAVINQSVSVNPQTSSPPLWLLIGGVVVGVLVIVTLWARRRRDQRPPSLTPPMSSL